MLFTDIVDSTSQASTLWATRAGATRNERIIGAVSNLARFRGREVKTMGDGFLATFDGPARAVRCAEAIVQTMRPLGIVDPRRSAHRGESPE